MCIFFALMLVGCQSFGGGASAPSSVASKQTTLAASDPLSALVGEFDNNAQVWRVQTQLQSPAPQPAKGKAAPIREAVPLRVHQHVRVLEHKNAGSALLLWQLDVTGAAPPVSATWLFRVTIDANGVTLLPYRATDPAAIAARLGDAAKRFEVQPNEWVELDACALHGTMQAGHLVASVDQASCASLLPGIGASAALLPLRIDADAEILRVATFADQARSPTALQEARRVRWFGGWAAINGAGPHATMDSKDWHEQRSLRIHDEGGLLAVLWRDGSRSGYSVELSRQNVGGDSQVLKLAVIEDASARTLSYVWANPDATRIGMHLGWVQVGLELQGEAPTAH
ncbi:hypothetical protein ELE36_08275 [Pseudolysobacter antarcticus]|uniref:Uncharacterized protein n=1 Tax=Pseudolysobacter antarcticus TaxID=2511995 RepID=A0A411HIJ9_9GAMM|nr:hypothetical protein [Pseudolysobacter antarcticus]QBB70362.1 hypothetical protein ELE36_08275 [Pseudolysobacter antarcticus]